MAPSFKASSSVDTALYDLSAALKALCCFSEFSVYIITHTSSLIDNSNDESCQIKNSDS